MTKITVIDGDITQVKADAILTTINSNGMWIGAIDRAILKVAGTMFHDQATSMGQGDMGPLTSGDALYTTAFVSHEGAFKDEASQRGSRAQAASHDDRRGTVVVAIPA